MFSRLPGAIIEENESGVSDLGAAIMKTIVRQIEHMDWANRRLISAIEDQQCRDSGILSLFHHVLAAEKVWIVRLQGLDSSHLVLWTTSDVERLKEMVLDNGESYRVYLEELNDDDLDKSIAYRNQSGQPFETSVRDILAHVTTHGQYHRGQINRMLRQAGSEPVALDYIIWARER